MRALAPAFVGKSEVFLVWCDACDTSTEPAEFVFPLKMFFSRFFFFVNFSGPAYHTIHLLQFALHFFDGDDLTKIDGK